MIKLQFESNKQYKITLPKTLVEALGWSKGDILKIRLHEKSICISREITGGEDG